MARRWPLRGHRRCDCGCKAANAQLLREFDPQRPPSPVPPPAASPRFHPATIGSSKLTAAFAILLSLLALPMLIKFAGRNSASHHTPLPLPVSIAACLSGRKQPPIPPAWSFNAMKAAWAIPNHPEIAIAWAAEDLPLRLPETAKHPLDGQSLQYSWLRAVQHMREVVWGEAIWWADPVLEEKLVVLRQSRETVQAGLDATSFLFRICSLVLTHFCDRLLPQPINLLWPSLRFTADVAAFCDEVGQLSHQDWFSLEEKVLTVSSQVREAIWRQIDDLLRSRMHTNEQITGHNGSLAPELQKQLDDMASIDAQAMLLRWIALTMLHRLDAVSTACASPSPFEAGMQLLQDYHYWENHQLQFQLQLRNSFRNFSGNLPSFVKTAASSTAPQSTRRGVLRGETEVYWRWQKTPLEQFMKRSSVYAVCQSLAETSTLLLSDQETACIESSILRSSPLQQQIWRFWWHHANPHWITINEMTHGGSQALYRPLENWANMDTVQPCRNLLQSQLEAVRPQKA